MRIGLIARADNTGLGIQSKEFFDHIPCKALVIDSSLLAPSQADILEPHMDRYPGQQVYQLMPGHPMTGGIPEHIIREFIKDIDILFAMETPYDYNIFGICREQNVRTILQLNYEFLDYPSHYHCPDLFAAPSTWHYDDIPGLKTHLPVPVNITYEKPLVKRFKFIHCAGRPAIYDRNGTAIFLESLNYVTNKIQVDLISQVPLSFGTPRFPNVKMRMFFGDSDNYHEKYTGGVLVLPRKYGGLCLPMQEAIAAHMPVITTDVPPNNVWLPKQWLVPAVQKGCFRAKQLVELYETDPVRLAKKIDEFCDDTFYYAAVLNASNMKYAMSWESLLPEYMKTFRDILV